MQATLNIITNPFHPARDRVQKKIKRRLSIQRLVHQNKIDLSKPVICLFNGQAVLRDKWRSVRAGDGDVISFVHLPQGGGGSNPLRIVLMIAVTIIAPYVAGALFQGAVLGGAMSSTMLAMATAGITMVGTMLVNALIPPPKPPAAQRMADLNASPTYTLAAQGNQARIGQPIPVVYGRHRVYPDFAAMPYNEFESNDQYLYQLFCIGQGQYQVHLDTLKVEDSAIQSFPGAEWEVAEPGQKVTLFPTGVITAGEVAGQELDSLGPFVINPAETEISKIAVDVVCPRGLYYANDAGGLDSRSVSFSFYARKVDDYGNPLVAEFLLGSHSISGASTTAIRKTYKYNVAAGRYTVRAVRTSGKDTDARTGNDLIWTNARGYLTNGTDTYQGVTMLAVKIKATNEISQHSSRKINLEVTRKLPVPTWNGITKTYDWSAPQPTRSPAWAAADVLRAQYGAGLFDARIDIGQLINMDTLSQSRGDYFDAVFDSPQTLWDALSAVTRSIRSRPFIQSGVVHFVRDQLQTLPTALFTSRNIVKGSFKITYVMPSEDSSDCVDVTYWDRLIWKERTVRASLEGLPSDKPAQVKAFGITDRNHAWREGMYMAAKNRYCRKEITFETELEGHIPSLGDMIAIQSDIPEWGEGGEVLGLSGRTLTLSEPITWTNGAQHYVMLRRTDGSAWGAAKVNQGVDNKTIVIDSTESLPDFAMQISTGKEKTYFSFGRSGQVVQLAKITAIRPRSKTVQISAINEDVRVHSADGGSVPLDLVQWSLTTPTHKPVVTDLYVVQIGSGTTPSVTATWSPVAGATRYIIQISQDNQNWSTLSEIVSTSYTFTAARGNLWVRVAAYGGALGPWMTQQVQIGLIPPPPNVTGGTVASSGPTFEFKWNEVVDADGYVVEVLYAGNVKRQSTITTNSYRYSWEMAYADGGPWRNITLRVKAKKGSVLSQSWHDIAATNAAPAAPTLVARSGVKSIALESSLPADLDYAGTIFWGSTDENFVPSNANKVFEGTSTFFMLEGVTQPMYFVAAHYDTYGRDGLNYSAKAYAVPGTAAGITNVTELPVSPADVAGQNAIYLEHSDEGVRGIYGWDGTQWIRVGALTEGSVTTDKLAPGAVDYTKLALGAVQARNLAVKKHFIY